MIAARVLAAPVSARTWRETGYLLAGLLLAVPGTALVLLVLVAVPLSVLTVGLPLLVGVLAAARGWARGCRATAGLLLGRSWPAPPAVTGRGLLGRARAQLTDPSAWRALGYAAVKLPLAVLGGYVVALLAVGGVFALTCPAWWWVFPTGLRELEVGGWGSSWLVAVPGLAAVLLFPWAVRLLVRSDAALIGGLLAGDDRSRRISQLEQARDQLSEDAAATLRRVERDLHDGTQAHLVALGMTLSRIRSRTGPAGTDTDRLLESAQSTVRAALAELRELVRGLHPPALDAGLPTALQTLVARSAVPVQLHTELVARPPDAIASAAYFCAAELLTNVVRHAGAGHVRMTLCEQPPGLLRLSVEDDGRGGAGADPGGPDAGLPAADGSGAGGSGLAGLRRRVTALDGALHVRSPPGGPTVVTVTLPLAAPATRPGRL